jgi:hypothetical protein
LFVRLFLIFSLNLGLLQCGPAFIIFFFQKNNACTYKPTKPEILSSPVPSIALLGVMAPEAPLMLPALLLPLLLSLPSQ